MATDITAILAALLAGNHGPDPTEPGRRRPPDYGVEASLDGPTLRLALTFRSGSAYCCPEYGCHLEMTAGRRWRGLREALAAHGMAAPPKLELRLTCVIEEGAAFFDWSRPDKARRGWYAFRPEAEGRFEVCVEEAGPGPDADAHEAG